MFPVSAVTGTYYVTVLGNQYRYDGLAWQIDSTTNPIAGAQGVQGLTGISGSTGIQGYTGSGGSTNDGTNITYSDSGSVAQKVSPKVYGQMRCDQTMVKSILPSTYFQFADFTSDFVSSLVSATNNQFVIQNGGDGTYCIGFSLNSQQPDNGKVQRWKISVDGTMVQSFFTALSTLNQYYEMAGTVVTPLNKDSTVTLWGLHQLGSTANITTAPGVVFYLYRVGR